MIFWSFILVGILGGTTGALIKYATLQVHPAVVVIIRLGLSTLFLLPFAIKFKIDIGKKNIRLVIISSILLLSNILLFSIGVRHTSAVISQVIYVPTSVLVAVFGYFLLKEKLSTNHILGLTITIAGILMLAAGSFLTRDIKSFGEPFGNFLIIIGLFTWAGFFIASRKLAKDLSPLSISFMSTLFAFIFSLIISSPYILFNQSITLNVDQKSAAVLIASSVTSVVFLYLSQTLIKKTSAFIASLVTYVNPIAAALWGIILFYEKPTFYLIISSIVIFAGVFIATSYNYLKQNKI